MRKSAFRRRPSGLAAMLGMLRNSENWWTRSSCRPVVHTCAACAGKEEGLGICEWTAVASSEACNSGTRNPVRAGIIRGMETTIRRGRCGRQKNRRTAVDKSVRSIREICQVSRNRHFSLCTRRYAFKSSNQSCICVVAKAMSVSIGAYAVNVGKNDNFDGCSLRAA